MSHQSQTTEAFVDNAYSAAIAYSRCQETSRRTSLDRYQKTQVESRQGVATILGLILTLGLMVVMAITLDFGRIHVAQTELRRSADAAAMAACWEMYDQQSLGAREGDVELLAKQAANEYVLVNTIIQESSQLSNDDVELGHYDIHGNWDGADPASFNAVRVTLNRHSNSNGELPLIFGSITGRDTQALSRSATAAMLASISGFQSPPNSDSHVNILPIALDLPSWLDAVANATTDDYAYVNGHVVPGSDGIFETNLYPKGTGAPGNRGTVDIGGANNSTSDLSRQILTGISAQDFEDLGIPLEFGENGILELNGDTGISAGIKDELASLIGKTRIIPIYTTVVGNGNNAMYSIVRFEGVRILDVKLTGKRSGKRVIIQPAKVLARNATIDFTGAHTSSHLVTPVMLVE